jgi:hypothetical protein
LACKKRAVIAGILESRFGWEEPRIFFLGGVKYYTRLKPFRQPQINKCITEERYDPIFMTYDNLVQDIASGFKSGVWSGGR